MIAPPHLIIFTRETKPGTHKPIRFLVPFAISFITNQCDDDKLNKAIFLHHTIICLYCYFNFVSQREDCFGQVWYVIVFPSKWHFIVCISVLNVYGNKIELLRNWVVAKSSWSFSYHIEYVFSYISTCPSCGCISICKKFIAGPKNIACWPFDLRGIY